MSDVRHISTQDVWELTRGEKVYRVLRLDVWRDGEQEWRVDEHGVEGGVVDGLLFHELVREIQAHLLRRD